MIVVIEGSDDTGKTVLAKEFVKMGYEYVHNGKPEPGTDLFQFYLKQVADAADRNVVFDRLHLGETVYGPIMRDKSLITAEQLRLINRLIYGLGGAIILCDTNANGIVDRWRSRIDSEYVKEVPQLRAIIGAFRHLADTEFVNHISFLRYNMTEYQGMADHFARSTIMNAVGRLPVGVTGSPTAKYLFVGERANSELDAAFLCDKRSSAFLNRCLWDAGFNEWEMAFVNAFFPDGSRRRLRGIRDTWPKVNFIALGLLAQKECLAQGVPFLPAPHPQYVKRFQSKDHAKYTKLLSSLA